ncbi:MAG: hypothetical protein M0R70_01860 [Nitrospirae bacterium]|nr:hypothetical protein [Nitrospirota bacterium]
MDTDELTAMAYETISLAHEVLDALCLELGASAKEYLTEDAFLNGTLASLKDILADPEGYLDSWNYLDMVSPQHFIKGIKSLISHVEKTLNTPQYQRGKSALGPSESTKE